MQGVLLSSKSAGQVGVALPVSKVRTLHRAIAPGREAAMWQRVGEDVADGLPQVGAAGEITTPMCRITPGSILCPIPCRHAEFGVVAIGDWTPACRERLLQNVWRIDLIDIPARQNIDRAAECAIGAKGINGVTWCHVNANCGRSFGDSGLELASSRPNPCQHQEEKLLVDAAMQDTVADHGQDRRCARKRRSNSPGPLNLRITPFLRSETSNQAAVRLPPRGPLRVYWRAASPPVEAARRYQAACGSHCSPHRQSLSAPVCR